MSQNVNLTKEDLLALIGAAVAAAVSEAKKPIVTEKEQREIELAQQMRKQSADSVKQQEENKRAFQRICSHEHARREGGGTHAVYVREEPVRIAGVMQPSPGFILCQKCQVRVRPLSSRKDENGNWIDPTATYDTTLFNKLFQDCHDGGLIGG
jgi:hypothetical protein